MSALRERVQKIRSLLVAGGATLPEDKVIIERAEMLGTQLFPIAGTSNDESGLSIGIRKGADVAQDYKNGDPVFLLWNWGIRAQAGTKVEPAQIEFGVIRKKNGTLYDADCLVTDVGLLGIMSLEDREIQPATETVVLRERSVWYTSQVVVPLVISS